MDWMSDFDINVEMNLLFSKLDKEKGRIFWRSFSDGVHACPLLWLNSDQVDCYDDRLVIFLVFQQPKLICLNRVGRLISHTQKTLNLDSNKELKC